MSGPRWFGAPGRPLFGWLHAPRDAARAGVVLVPSFGVERTRAVRSYRALAERLARAGLAVLRFDLHGTGDSAGDERDPERVSTWLADVGLAIDEVRRASGARPVALVGLRLGATLAASVAAARGDVDALVLWSPCASGDGFVRDLAKQQSMYERLVPYETATEAGITEVLGAVLTDETIAGLAALDALALARAPAPRALVVDAVPDFERHPLALRLRELGTLTEVRPCPTQKFLFTVPHRAPLPIEAIDAVAGWVAGWTEALPLASGERAHAPRPTAPPKPSRATGARDESQRFADALRERPVFYDEARALFGVLTLPSPEHARPGRPVVVVLNAGTVDRAGPHRLHVRLARGWAARGFCTLRVDVAGIGDSPVEPGDVDNLTYPRTWREDARAAIDFACREARTGRALLVGLCSGADIAFQTTQRDARVAALAMLNPRTFLELDLDRVERQRPQPAGADPEGTEQAARVTRGLEAIATRGTEVLLVVSVGDPGIDYVDRHVPEASRRLADLPRFRREDLARADHTFTGTRAQARVADLLAELVAAHA